MSREARKRLPWFDHYQAHGGNAALTCRYFGISREAFYRWKRRYDPQQLSTLEDRSHRPHQRRHPAWTAEQAEQIRRLREQFPRWGKDKLAVLLRREGWAVSVSMVGRILLRPAPNVVLKQFTAPDRVSRWDVIGVHHRATSTAATLLLGTLQRRLPFPLRDLQVDGGSEFAALLEAACQQRSLGLFVLPPRSPKLNGRVERANRTHTEEFYEINACSLPITQLNRELEAWERTYNTVRSHQALGYLTPQQFLAQTPIPQKGP